MGYSVGTQEKVHGIDHELVPHHQKATREERTQHGPVNQLPSPPGMMHVEKKSRNIPVCYAVTTLWPNTLVCIRPLCAGVYLASIIVARTQRCSHPGDVVRITRPDSTVYWRHVVGSNA